MLLIDTNIFLEVMLKASTVKCFGSGGRIPDGLKLLFVGRGENCAVEDKKFLIVEVVDLVPAEIFP